MVPLEHRARSKSRVQLGVVPKPNNIQTPSSMQLYSSTLEVGQAENACLISNEAWPRLWTLAKHFSFLQWFHPHTIQRSKYKNKYSHCNSENEALIFLVPPEWVLVTGSTMLPFSLQVYKHTTGFPGILCAPWGKSFDWLVFVSLALHLYTLSALLSCPPPTATRIICSGQIWFCSKLHLLKFLSVFLLLRFLNTAINVVPNHCIYHIIIPHFFFFFWFKKLA